MPESFPLTLQSFEKMFPNDDACLLFLFSQKYGDAVKCPRCENVDCFYRVSKRKVFECSYCSHQISPCAHTIFHKSSTSLKLWFLAIFHFLTVKNGISALELHRLLGVSYPTAFRMGHQIRSLMKQEDFQLENTVEVDETYIGGKRRGRRGRGAQGKTPVVGIVERNGRAKAWVTEDVTAQTLLSLIHQNVKKGSTVMSDEFRSYSLVSNLGYKHETVSHGIKEYVRGNVHTNTIEGFWGQLKRSISGTHHSISRKYLQMYVNEYVFRYNSRRVYPLSAQDFTAHPSFHP